MVSATEDEGLERMPKFRLSLAATMTGIAVLGLVLAAARFGWYFSFRALYVATVFLLLTSIVAARYRPKREAAFWFGFAVFGWGYFTIGLGDWSTWGPAGPIVYPPFPTVNHLLPTKEWMESIADSLTFRMKMQRTGVGSPEINFPYWTMWSSLVGIGHLLFTLVFAVAGGVIASAIASRSRVRSITR